MHVLVIGGGVIGVTTAYYLQQHGFGVTLVEAGSGLATGASHANAGQLSADYATPWAAPGIPLQAIKWLCQQDAPLAIKLTGQWRQYRWLWQALSNCNQSSYQINKKRMLALARYSRECMDQLRVHTGISFDAQQLGLTQLLRTERQMEQSSRDLAVLQQLGIAHRLLHGTELLQVEPALAGSLQRLAGGLHLPDDQTGDCHEFCLQLAQLLELGGAQILLDSPVQCITCTADLISGVVVNGRTLRADHYVMAAGHQSAGLLLQLGIDVPLYPLKGYSLTYQIASGQDAPRSTVLDESSKVAITRLGNRVRVGGMAELCGNDLSLPARRRRTLEKVVNELYPAAGDSDSAEFWAGLRPSTPDSVPILGRCAYANLWLNLGHGTLGWTMACGSAQYLTDLLLGRPAAFADGGLDIFRYS